MIESSTSRCETAKDDTRTWLFAYFEIEAPEVEFSGKAKHASKTQRRLRPCSDSDLRNPIVEERRSTLLKIESKSRLSARKTELVPETAADADPFQAFGLNVLADFDPTFREHHAFPNLHLSTVGAPIRWVRCI